MSTNKKMNAETPVINAGLRVTVQQEFARRDAERAQIEKERAQRGPSSSRLSRLKIMADTPYFIKFLHDFEKGVDLFVHMWRGLDLCFEICKVHYGDKCDICEMTNSFGEKCRPSAVRCFIGWVYNSVGQTFTKNDRTYKLNPLKLIMVPLGKDSANITVLQEASTKRRGNYFATDIWQIERKKGKTGGFCVPKTVEESKFLELIGRDVSLEVSKEAELINSGNALEILTMILTAFQNVDWEKLGIAPPTLPEGMAELTPRKEQNIGRGEHPEIEDLGIG